jgi:ribosomal protein L40E
MSFVCKMCGTPWANARVKPCTCWWGVRIWAPSHIQFVCARCGNSWPIGHKPCRCWPNGIRVRADEVGQQEFPLPGI